MPNTLILASKSKIRSDLLAQAGINHDIVAARVDEEMVKTSLIAEGHSPRNIADALAELKAEKIARKNPDRFVLGCDQVLDFEGNLLSKASSPDQAISQLNQLSGKTHHLYAAAVLYEEGRPIWRHVGTAKLWMRDLSEEFISGYVGEYWDEIQYCVGCYRIEEEGLRLFRRIDGDYFSIQGLPVLDLLSFLSLRSMVRT